MPSLFEARRRLPTSATAFRRAGNQTRALRSSQGRRPRPPSFSDVPRPLPCGSGGTRRAARRPSTSTPVPVPPACAGLPDRDVASDAPPPRLAPRSIVRINVHGSKDRAKDASPKRRSRSLVPASGACALWRMPTSFPSSATFERPLSSARCYGGRIRIHRSDGPTKALVPTTPREERRLPEDRDAFYRHDTRRNVRRGRIAPSGLRAGSPAHAAHTLSPGWGQCL